jgi:hypothetical protein
VERPVYRRGYRLTARMLRLTSRKSKPASISNLGRESQ